MRRGSCIALLLLSVSCGPDANQLNIPAWKISKNGMEGLLIGTFHKTPAGMTQRIPAGASEGQLHLEAVENQRVSADRAFLRNSIRQETSFSSTEKEAIERMEAAKKGDGARNKQTWAIAYAYTRRMTGSDPDATEGTEQILMKTGKRLPSSLEDPGLLYDDLASMPDRDQQIYLREAIHGNVLCDQDVRRRGRLDEAEMTRCVERAHLYLRMFIDRRNERMCGAIDRAMRKDGGVFAVGAAHLFGRRSIVECLKKKGYQVDRT